MYFIFVFYIFKKLIFEDIGHRTLEIYKIIKILKFFVTGCGITSDRNGVSRSRRLHGPPYDPDSDERFSSCGSRSAGELRLVESVKVELPCRHRAIPLRLENLYHVTKVRVQHSKMP
jgi:hypothetical protein